jgi:hypothetical protein
LEAFPKGTTYRPLHDLSLVCVQWRLFEEIKVGLLKALMIGVPCRTWGPAARRNQGTRSLDFPDGGQPGSCILPREIEGNLQAQFVATVCELIHEAAGYFYVENPASSYIFKSSWFRKLYSRVPIYTANLHQCAYGLILPGAQPHLYCRKHTHIISNDPAVTELTRLCPGFSLLHQHEHAWGQRIVQGTSHKLTTEAGHYPLALANEIARVIYHTVYGRHSSA